MRTELAAFALPFRVGATSYVVPGDLLHNAAYLAPRVGDMQLVLFDVSDGPCNVPTPAEVAALAELGQQRNLGYTVHLIHDLVADGADHPSLRSACEVMLRTRPLRPHAYILHLDGRRVRMEYPASRRYRRWADGQVRALRQLGAWMDDPLRLAVENLEGYPPDFVAGAVAAAEVSRCVDVGHYWLDGHDPLPYLAAALPRTRVVHLHGVVEDAQGRRDHQSLAAVDSAQLDCVIELLLRAQFGGVVTLEVFEEADFQSSLAALLASLERVWQVQP